MDPPAKKSKNDSGEAVPVEVVAVAPAAAVAAAPAAASSSSSAAAAAAAVPRPIVSMRDDLMDMQIIKQGAEGVSTYAALHSGRAAALTCARPLTLLCAFVCSVLSSACIRVHGWVVLAS